MGWQLPLVGKKKVGKSWDVSQVCGPEGLETGIPQEKDRDESPREERLSQVVPCLLPAGIFWDLG